MNWFDWPAIVFLVTFAVALAPSRRPSHYLFAFLIAFGCGGAATALTLIVWGITR